MHVALLFPPATDPRSPHLAIPSLAACLRQAGVRTTVRDLDLEGLLALTEPACVETAAETCRRRLRGSPLAADELRLRRALAFADVVVADVGRATTTLRDAEAFFDPHRYHGARETIAAALELASAAAGSVAYNIGPVRYDVAGCDAASLADLERVTADPTANLFHELWQDGIVRDLAHDRPDVVGISILNHQQVVPGLTLARTLRAEGHFVVLGGTVYAKFVPELLARPRFFELFCDALVPYEGETALLALLDALDGRRNLERVPNLMRLTRNGPALGPVHTEDVSRLPTPDFDGLPLDDYLTPSPVLPILTGKGCYFNRCKFCDIPFINGVAPKPYRVRTPEQVAADVAELQRRHGVRHFEITDEALAPQLLLRIGEALAAHDDVDARFVGYARLQPGFTADVCRRLYAFGIRKLFFGLESGSQRMLDHMDKGIRVDEAKQVLRNCKDAGLSFHVFSIVGFPEETEADARETLRFLLEESEVLGAPANSFDVHPFTLDLRTAYFENAAAYGVVVDQEDLARRDFPLSAERWENTRGLSSGEVDALLDEFTAELRRAYPDYRSYPAHLWPGFEEYSLLYASHYEERRFAFRYSLPPDGDPLPFGLVWSDDAKFTAVEGGWLVSSLMGSTLAGTGALELLARPTATTTVDALLDQLAARVPTAGDRASTRGAVRAVVDELLASGALRLRPRSAAELSAVPA